ncbi:MAG: hypothetical protein HDS58_02505 [Barnesiella sp.]|nr:hypothetical protein [Bacteroidales bacterium]MBD5245695.1 hypothetical protein [Barnesiella sp.]MBD5248944.1 hypothetical protein [Barnesiella sp.]
MKKYSAVILAIMALIIPAVVNAAPQNDERKQFFKEIREFKHKFLARELNLTKEQEQKFFPIYDQMEDETDKIQEETREMENKVRESSDPSDLEYEKATDAIFELKMKEGEIEKSYLEKFRGVLNNKQLFNLKNAERNFNRDLMKQHNRLRQKKNKNQ